MSSARILTIGTTYLALAPFMSSTLFANPDPLIFAVLHAGCLTLLLAWRARA